MGERLGFITPEILSRMDFKELFLSVNETAKRFMDKNRARKINNRFIFVIHMIESTSAIAPVNSCGFEEASEGNRT
jgi:hypothetical protein